MTLKVTQGHRNCCYSIGHTSLPISVLTTTSSCTVSDILPHLQRTWLPVTLRRPTKDLKLQATCAFRFMNNTFPEIFEVERFETLIVTFKDIQGHWWWCHSLRYIHFLCFRLPLHLCLFSTVFEILSLIYPTNLKAVEAPAAMGLRGSSHPHVLANSPNVTSNLYFSDLSLRVFLYF